MSVKGGSVKDMMKQKGCSSGSGEIRVLMIDDFRLCRVYFAEGLRQSSSFEVSEADDLSSALLQIKKAVPDVILLSIFMRHCSGISLLQTLHSKFPKIGILAFSYLHHDRLYAQRSICAGAAGYISVDEDPEPLIDARQVLANDGVYLNQELRKDLCLTAGERGMKESPFERLSHREFEVFCLTGHGYVPKRIAERLKVNVKTVDTYRERIRAKLNLEDGAALLFHATTYIREQSLPQAS